MSIVNSPEPEYAVDGKPRERLTWRHYALRGGTVILTALMIVVIGNTWISGNLAGRLIGTDAMVRGAVVNAQKQPLVGAQVFIESAPKVMAATDARGNFSLTAVPSGKQVLVVVSHEMIGQEFPVELVPNSETQVGSLVYGAPPDQ